MYRSAADRTAHQRRAHGAHCENTGSQRTGAAETQLIEEPSDEDEDKFLAECAAQNVMLEGCILHAAIKHDVTSLFKKLDDIVSRGTFAAVEGDVFVVLNVMRTWVNELRTSVGNNSWIEDNGLEQKMLENIEGAVQAVHAEFKRRHPKAPGLNFRGNLVGMANSLTDIVVRTRAHDLYVYSGQDALGYKNISNGKVLYLDPSSILNYYTNKPKFIIPLITNSNPSVAEITEGQRQVLMCHPAVSLHGSLVLAVPGTLAISVLNNTTKGGAEAILPDNTCLIIPDIGYTTSKRLSQRWNDHVDGKPSVTERIVSISGDGDFVVVDIDLNKCELRVFCDESVHLGGEPLQNAVNEIIMAEINEIRSELSSGTIMLPYPKVFSASSLIIGQGLQSDRYLFPGESTRALVKPIPDVTTTWSDVVSILDSYKDTAMFHKRSPTDIRGDVLGTIMMESPDALQKVVAESQSHSFPFRLTLQYGADITAGSLYYFCDDLSLSLVWKVHMDRYTKPKVTPADVARVRATLCRILDDLPEDKVNIYITAGTEEKRRGIVRAQILFTDRNTAHRGLDLVRDLASRGVPVQIENQEEVEDRLRSLTLTIKDELFKVLSKTLLAKLENFRLSNIYQARYNLDFNTPGVVCVHLTTATGQACAEVMTRLRDTITPQSIKLSRRDVAHVVSPEGNAILKRLMRDTVTCISVSDHTDELLVYGTRSARKNVEEVVLKHLGEVAELNYVNGDEPYKFVHPKDDRLPNDLLLSLANQMQQFYISPNLLVVKTQSGKGRDHVIAGLKKGYRRRTKGEPEIEIPEPRDIETRQCVSCYIDLGADDKCYVLEGCGHVYCMECLRTQVTEAVSTTSFPVRCAHDNQPFSAVDFINITDKLHIISRNRLMKASVRDFVNTHPQNYRFCNRLNCVGVGQIKKTSLDNFLQCSTCNKKSCPKCFLFYHKFMTCEQAGTASFSLDEWLMEDRKNRKKCPNCRIGIEKIEGCNRVTCSCCNKHICWNCLKYYDTSGDCYQHLNKVHGGYGF